MVRQTVMIRLQSEVVVEEIPEDRQVVLRQVRIRLAAIQHEIIRQRGVMEHERIPEGIREEMREDLLKVAQQHEDEQVVDEVEDLVHLLFEEVEASMCVVMVSST